MTVMQRIRADYLEARKSGHPLRGTLMTLIGEAETQEKNFPQARALTDDEVVALVRKFMKNIAETLKALEASTNAGADERRATLRAETALLAVYLPSLLDDAQVEAVARERKVAGDDMGAVMKFLKATYPGAYDGKTASGIVKRVMDGAI